MREAYTGVLERLLMVHSEAEEGQTLQTSRALVNNEDTVNSWPPWPWPPWGDDDGGDGDRPGDHPKNATELAEEVVKFERKLAQASLDLSGHFEKGPTQMLMVAQRRLIPGSFIHLQQGSHFQHHRDYNPGQFSGLLRNVYTTQLSR